MQLIRSKLTPLADPEIANADRPDADANQLEYLAGDGFDHSSDLTIAALVDGDFDV